MFVNISFSFYIFYIYDLRLLFVDQLCGLPSYKPGDSLFWNVAWTRLGSCTGTIHPTGSPVHVHLTDVGGCPEEFSKLITYEAGEKVHIDGVVFQCKEWPHSVYCNSQTFEPPGLNSDMAWDVIGIW